MNEDLRWKQRFDNLQSTYLDLQEAIAANAQAPDNKLIQMALVKAFEMTFELSWKTMKDLPQVQRHRRKAAAGNHQAGIRHRHHQRRPVLD